jgi:hypothetical protein
MLREDGTFEGTGIPGFIILDEQPWNRLSLNAKGRWRLVTVSDTQRVELQFVSVDHPQWRTPHGSDLFFTHTWRAIRLEHFRGDPDDRFVTAFEKAKGN